MHIDVPSHRAPVWSPCPEWESPVNGSNYDRCLSVLMPAGVRATDICPIADVSSELTTTTDSVNSNVCPQGDAESVVEFSLDADNDIETGMTPIFSLGSRKRYRLTLDDDSTCPCTYLSQFE